MAWLGSFERQILKNKEEIREFKSKHDPKKHFISISYFWCTPLFYTKEKTINQKSVDWSNMAKIPDDCLFKILEIDDSQVCYGQIAKIPSSDEDYHLRLEVSLCPIENMDILGGVMERACSSHSQFA